MEEISVKYLRSTLTTRGFWKANGGGWREFNGKDPPLEEQVVVVARCAEILEIRDSKKKQMEKILRQILPEYSPDVLGDTDLTEHHNQMLSETLIGQKFCRRPPKKIEAL